MILDVVQPVFKPQQSSYRALGGVLRIYVGSENNETENEDNWTIRHWTLKDVNNVVVQSGDVAVQDNTFESYVDVVGLLKNTVYIFTINNEQFKYMSATIITFTDMSIIEIINNKTIFDEPISIYGDLIYPDVSDGPRHVRFPYDWDIARTLGSGIIRGKTTGKWFVYVPLRILTRDRGHSSIAYTPIAGKAEVDVPVIQLIDVRKVDEYEFVIIPASKVKVLFNHGSPSITETYTSPSSVSKVKLRDINPTINGAVHVEISQIFS